MMVVAPSPNSRMTEDLLLDSLFSPRAGSSPKLVVRSQDLFHNGYIRPKHHEIDGLELGGSIHQTKTWMILFTNEPVCPKS